VQPVLRRIVEERQQRLSVVDDLGDRLGPLGPVVADQRFDGLLGVDAVLGPMISFSALRAPAWTLLGNAPRTLATL
jgi:hypothetical protein